MAELFAPQLSDLVACAEREIAMRERAYPRWVEDRRMRQETADRELALMKAVADALRCLRQARVSGLLPAELIRQLPAP